MIKNYSPFPMPLPLAVFLILTAIFVGDRGSEIGTDTENYIELYRLINSCMCMQEGFEPGIQVFALFNSALGLSVNHFFATISIVLWFLLMTYVAQILQGGDFSKRHRRFLFYCVAGTLLSSPFVLAAHINIIRQGVATAFLYMAALSFLRRRWHLFVINGVLACTFHFSSALYISAFLLLHLTFRRLFMLVMAGSILYSLGLTQAFTTFLSGIAGFSSLRIILSYGLDAEYRSGVRIDFLIFTWFIFFVGYMLSRFLRDATLRSIIIRQLKIFLVLIIPFLLFGYAGYSDRYLYPAWILSSIIFGVSLYGVPFFRRLQVIFLPMVLLLSGLQFLTQLV